MILAFMIAVAHLEGTLLAGAQAAEWPVDSYAAVAASRAVLVRGAILVLNKSQALPFLALLRDALDVLTTVSPWVEQ